MADIFEKLNEQQRQAVRHINGPLQIIAGAGSGKTRVITHRIANLIQCGVMPWNILALTFTNKAADEMKTRIAQLVDEENASKIYAGTFHSIFARLLRVEAENLGYTKDFTIYDTDNSEKAVQRILKDMGIDNKTARASSVFARISNAKNRNLTPEDYGKRVYSDFDQIVANIFYKYENYLKESNAMDFDDLLLNMNRLLENHVILQKYQERFHYILVDEYQDTNLVQYYVLKKLAASRQNICVVGDDAQSIYGWRGANIANILNFEKEYPYCTTIKLETNYRSTKNILATAHSVIKNNKQQLPKILLTDNEKGEKVQLLANNTDRDEASIVIKDISQKLMNGESPSEIAILYRANWQSLPFENVCRTYNIPYIVIGGQSFYKRKEVKDVMAYLQLLVNPQDNESFARIVNEPPRGIGDAGMRKITENAIRDRKPMLEVIADSNSLNIRKQVQEKLQHLYNIIEKHTQLIAENAPVKHFEDYFKEVGLLEYYKEMDMSDATERLDNTYQLLNDLEHYLTSTPEHTLSSFLSDMSLISEVDEKSIKSNDYKIKIMTLHSAKGLEFNNVYITGCEERILPSSMAVDDGNEEEERRLFYVGITRAKKNLFLSYAKQRYRYGSMTSMAVSHFLREIEPELLYDVYGRSFLKPKPEFHQDSNAQRGFFPSHDSIPHLQRQFSSRMQITQPKRQYPAFDDMQYEEDYSQISATNKELFSIGNIVSHEQFGQGRIMRVDGLGDNQKLTIQFANVGKKTLMTKFAKLEKV